VRDRGPGDGPGREGGSACRGEKPPAGVESDEGPQGFVDAQPLARPPGRGGENGEGVAQQVAGAGQLVERVGVEPDEFLRAALPEPGEMTSAAGAAQPTADGGRRAAQRGGDPPISHACGLASQCGADHLGGVRPAWLQRGGQQDLSGSAPAGAARRSGPPQGYECVGGGRTPTARACHRIRRGGSPSFRRPGPPRPTRWCGR
jgi:hypothetical protein